MKKIYSFLATLMFALCMPSCQEDALEGDGYLRLEVGTNLSIAPQTRIAEDYNPKQIAVEIKDAGGNIVKTSDDWEMDLKGKAIRLKPGTYTIRAYSNGFDGSESGFNIPYYEGSTTATIASAGSEANASIVCTLANVKVTVKFDETLSQRFKSASVKVSSAVSGVAPLTFTMGTTSQSGYFPVGNLTAALTVVNQADVSHTRNDQFTGVAARQHYILNYKTAEAGSAGGDGKVDVSIDGSETVYTFTFNVSTEVSTSLNAANANAFSNFAYLEGEVLASEGELNPANMSFEYKAATASTWSPLAATKTGDKYTATLKGLTPATQYVYRMVYKDTEEYTSNEVTFTTEEATVLRNGDFENWSEDGKVVYADDNTSNSFWDSSNPGSAKYIGSNTTKETETVHGGSAAAKLVSKYAFIKFAAASLYTGKFGELVGTSGAIANFGQSFTDRPSALHGYMQYAPQTIGYVGSNLPDDVTIVKNQTTDMCSIYFALTTEAISIDNTKPETFVKWDSDDRVVAYGELTPSECVSTGGAWKEFTIPLEYHDLKKKPTHIVIVCSSSKYGDYFTGAKESTLYLDDFELIYGEPVVDPNYIQ